MHTQQLTHAHRAVALGSDLTACACVRALRAQSKFKALKFSCKHRQLLLTDLYQCMAAASAMGRCLLAAKVLG